MSKTIDEKVVEMRFDNRQFENNVQTSINTLGKLKQSLDMEKAASSFNQIDAAAKKVDMSGLSSAVETVKERFSAFEVMAVTALANITNSAVNAGKKLLYSLSIEPRKQGFEEYELKMGSIQTMMMSTGDSLETVNKYLDELNTYADKTIYSFSDMTSNIGKFTNAGVNLKDSVKAIQGISNVAAISGANSAEASRAMYNFAQALSAGSVKLIDWKSIENANMATVDFKNNLIKTALSLGTVKKEGDKYVSTTRNAKGETSEAFDATHLFNDSLNSQWMTTEVLVKTLNEYSDETTEIGKKAFAAAQDVKTFSQLMDTLKEAVGSGWATTWETIFGDFEEAKKLWTNVSNVIGDFIGKQSDARNALLKEWKDLGGRTAIIEALKNAFIGLKSIIIPVIDAFKEIFPPITAKHLMQFSNNLKNFTEKLKLSDTAAKNLKSTFRGLFAALDIIKQLFSALFKAIVPLVSVLGGKTGGLAGKILGITGSFGEWIVKLDETIKKNDTFNKSIQKVVTFVKKAIDAFKNFGETLRQKLHIPDLETIKKSLSDFFKKAGEKFVTPGLDLLHKVLIGIGDILLKVGNAFVKMKDKIVNSFSSIGDSMSKNKFIKFLETLWRITKRVVKGVIEALGVVATKIIDLFGKGDFKGIVDILNGILTGGVLISIKRFFKGITDSFDGLTGLLKGITGILDGVRDCLQAYQQNLKANTLLKIAAAIGILAASILVLATIDNQKLGLALGAITALFTELMIAMAIFTKISSNMKSTAKLTTTMLAMSVSLLMLASACKSLSKLNWSELAKGLTGVGILMLELSMFIKSIGQTKGLLRASTSLIAIGIGLKVMASACKSLGKIATLDLVKALAAIEILFLEVASFARLMGNSKGMIKNGTALIIIGAGLKTIASACKSLSRIDLIDLAKALAAVEVLFLEVTSFAKLTSNSKGLVKNSIALIAIGAGLKVIASACKSIGSIDLVTLAKALSATEILFLEIASFAKLTNKSKNMVQISLSLIAIGAGLKVLASACKSLGEIGIVELVKALASIEILFLEIASFVKLTGKSKGLFKTAAALTAFGIGLKIMASACKQFGNLGWEEILKALASIAGILVIVGAAGKLLAPVTKTILALGAALAVVGVGIIAIGAGLLAVGLGIQAISIGFTMLGGSLAIGATAITAAISVVILAIADLIPTIARKIGEAIVEFCNVISNSSSAIGKAIKTTVLTAIDVLVECVPPLVDGALYAISEVLKSLVKYSPPIIDNLLQFIIKLLEGIAQRMPELLKAALKVVASFFTSLVDAIKEFDTSTLEKAVLGVGIIALLMKTFANIVPSIPRALIGVAGVGAVIAEIGGIIAAIGLLQQIPGLNWLVNEGGKLLEAIGNAIGSMVGGLIGGVMRGITDQLPEIGTNLSNFMENLKPFLDGATRLDSKSLSGVRSLAEIILILTAAEVLDGIASWITGGSSLGKFSEEIALLGPGLKAFSDSIEGINSDAVKDSAVAAGALAALENGLKNHGGVFGFFTGDSNLADFGSSLEVLGTAIKSYSNSVKGIDSKAVKSSAVAAGTLAELENKLKDHKGVFQFFKGDSDLAEFGKNLLVLGIAVKKYGESIKGISPEAMTSSAIAAGSLAELENKLKDHKGIFQFFKGDSDLAGFGKCLEVLGPAVKKYSDSVNGINPESVTSSAIAAGSLAELENKLKDHKGVFQFFKGDSDLEGFGNSLKVLGPTMKHYSDSVRGISPDAVSSSAAAAESLAQLEENLKNHGGVFQLFAGDSDLSSFAGSLLLFGPAMSAYGKAIGTDFPSEAVVSSANAAKSLAELENGLRGHNGAFQIFAGDNNLGQFAQGIVPFGAAMKAYGYSIGKDFPSEAVISSANAAQALAELENGLKNHNGIFQIFTGDNDLGTFATGITPFGKAMRSYGGAIGNNFPSEAVISSANAAQALAELESGLKNHNGVFQIFTGDNDLGKFSKGITPFGNAMKEYGKSIGADFPAEAVTSSANAAQALAELESGLRNHEGIFQTIFGDNDLGKFAKGIEPFGKAMKIYGENIGTDFPAEAVTSSANAAQALAELESGLRNHEGIFQTIFGDNDIAAFGEGLKSFGPSLKEYGDSIDGLNPDVVSKSADAAKALAEISDVLPTVGGIGSWFSGNKQSLNDFGANISKLGDGIHGFYCSVFNDDANQIANIVASVVDIAQMGQILSKMDVTVFSKFGSNLKEMAKNGITGFTRAFVDAQPKMVETAKLYIGVFEDTIKGNQEEVVVVFNHLVIALAESINDTDNDFHREGEDIVENLIRGMRSMVVRAEDTARIVAWQIMGAMESLLLNFYEIGENISSNVSRGISGNKQVAIYHATELVTCVIGVLNKKYEAFKEIGTYLVRGFADGIESSIYLAQNASSTMAQRAADAARQVLDEHSPSKVGYEIGDYFGFAFVDAIDSYQRKSYSAGEDIADAAKSGLNETINKIQSLIENGIDSEPVIRPVLDLTDIYRGISSMNSFFGADRSIDLATKAGYSVSTNLCQGSHISINNSEIVAEINRLRADLSTLGEKITQMKVVMDTGALVGSMATPMNAALGRQSMYQRRGN